jgi:hypothetical protein
LGGKCGRSGIANTIESVSQIRNGFQRDGLDRVLQLGQYPSRDNGWFQLLAHVP